MKAQAFHWLWWGLSLVSDLTGIFVFLFALVTLFDRKPDHPWYVIPLALLSLWVAAMSVAASMQFHYWARLAIR
jgi:hypothetical protein